MQWIKVLMSMAVVAAITGAIVTGGAVEGATAERPNIVYILADDLGYGDLGCLNPQSKIASPRIDRLAAEGMIFTDAHSSSAVCTPTRYGILTGRYNWRTTLQQGVLGGFSPRLIEAGRLTVPMLLRDHGYRTACIGKWHLGMNWPLKQGGFANDYPDGWNVDYTQPIEEGPNTVGFDYYFGISASLDMPPYVFIENARTLGVPTVEKTYIRTGPAEKDFEAEDVLPTLTRKAVDYIGQQAGSQSPFFLYLPLNAPHTPIVPTPQWQGKSGLNAYGDFTMQVDHSVGEVLDALERHQLVQNTLVVLTSDNGCSPQANFPELLAKGHNPSYVFRGNKADIYDGGHHIPFIVRWPARVAAGSRCDDTICLVDLMATCAEIVGAKLPDNAGEDSFSLLAALSGRSGRPRRAAVVHHSINGSFAIREGQWKLALCPGSGGWSAPRPGTDTSHLPLVQLFDMTADTGEQTNVESQHPDVVARLTRLLEKFVAEGRSTPGVPQANAVEVDIWAAGKAAHRPLPAKKARKPKAAR